MFDPEIILNLVIINLSNSFKLIEVVYFKLQPVAGQIGPWLYLKMSSPITGNWSDLKIMIC